MHIVVYKSWGGLQPPNPPSVYALAEYLLIQYTSFKRAISGPDYFDPIKRNLAVETIKGSNLLRLEWFCWWSSVPNLGSRWLYLAESIVFSNNPEF